MIQVTESVPDRKVDVCPQTLRQLIMKADAAALPVAELVYIDSDTTYSIKDTFNIAVRDKQIGALSLRTRADRQTSWISRIDIDYPSFQGKGYGTYAHLAAASIALSNGNTFRNDPNGLSNDAMRVWERLIDSEIATAITKPWNNGSLYGWMGHFEIG